MYLNGIFIYIIAVGSCTAASTKRSPDDLPIKYPGPTKTIDMTRYSKPGDDAVAEDCRGQNYCHIKPEDYPQDKFDQLFENVTSMLPQPELLPDSLANRQGDINDKDDCNALIEFKPIFKVRDKRDDKWRTVVQSEKKNYVQKVRIEKCRNAGAACFLSFPNFPGITTHCKQKYAQWEIVVEGMTPGSTETVITDLPICCSCHYKTIDLEDRFGKTKTKE